MLFLTTLDFNSIETMKDCRLRTLNKVNLPGCHAPSRAAVLSLSQPFPRCRAFTAWQILVHFVGTAHVRVRSAHKLPISSSQQKTHRGAFKVSDNWSISPRKCDGSRTAVNFIPGARAADSESNSDLNLLSTTALMRTISGCKVNFAPQCKTVKLRLGQYNDDLWSRPHQKTRQKITVTELLLV